MPRRLGGGSYRVVVNAVDAAGNRARPLSASMRLPAPRAVHRRAHRKGRR
jgi:hypothetical protein